MSDDTNGIGKALDQVDSLRRRAQVAALVAMGLLLASLFWFGSVTRNTTDVALMLRTAVQVLVILTLATGFMVMFWVSHLTQRLLKAIDLSSNRSTK